LLNDMDVQVKISPFSGDKKDWERWSVTFLAKSRLRGYRELLVGIEIVPTKGGKDFEAFLIKNDVAYAELLIACECNVCFGIVNSSRSKQLPEGDARLAWMNLTAKFEPTTKGNLIQMKRDFIENKLSSISQDPDQWIQSLEIMRRKLQILGHNVTDMDLIIHILHNLPREYETTLELLENNLKNDLATLDRVKEKLREKFERIQRGKSSPEGALISRGREGKFKGSCTYCGIYGHKASDCFKKLN